MGDRRRRGGISRRHQALLASLAALLLAIGVGVAYGRAGVHPKTKRVSLSSAGAQGDSGSFHPVISADGRFIAFASDATNLVGGDTNGLADVFVRDRKTHKTRRVSLSSAGAQADKGSFRPAISADGRFVAFASVATNLVGGDTNGQDDIFVRDRKTGK